MYVMIIWDGSDLNETGIIQVSCKLLRFPPPYHIFILISFIMVHQMFLDFTFLVVCYFFYVFFVYYGALNIFTFFVGFFMLFLCIFLWNFVLFCFAFLEDFF